METPRQTVKRRAQRRVREALKRIRQTNNPTLSSSSLSRSSVPPCVNLFRNINVDNVVFEQDCTVSSLPNNSGQESVQNIVSNLDLESVNTNSVPNENCEFSIYSSPIKCQSRSTLLAEWATTNSITHVALGKLLGLLGEWMPNENFPKDARTLLQTPRKISTVSKCGGDYFYFGIRGYLEETLASGIVEFTHSMNKFKNWPNLLTLKIGIDGVPLSKSSNLQFWPILVSVDQARHKKVHVICLYYGKQKPDNIHAFLEDFVGEMKSLEENGIIKDIRYDVRIRCVVADAPARSFLKCIKNHNAYYGCERCSRKGKWKQRVIYPIREDGELYSDDSFESQTYEKHHNDTSPLVALDLGMITQIPLDYMHLCCLGVMKKLVLTWVEGIGHFRKREIQEVSMICLELGKQLPKQFSRKSRGICEVRHWKATEFRSFMLYVGPVALSGHLKKQKYKHFLLFHTAMVIMCSDICNSNEWLEYASKLLKQFVCEVPEVYQKEFLSYNMHSIQHLHLDVMQHGQLDRFSAFEFENFLFKLKSMIRTNKHHLKQVIHRVVELRPFLNDRYTEQVVTLEKNTFFVSKCGRLCKIRKIAGDKIFVRVFSIKNIEGYPCPSSILFIGKVGQKGSKLMLARASVLKICIVFNLDNELYVYPCCNLK